MFFTTLPITNIIYRLSSYYFFLPLCFQDAIHLSRRPPFHNSGIIVIVVMSCWLLSAWRVELETVGLMFLTSWLSHHLRDANRRGLWLYPFGSTLSLPAWLYVTMIVCLGLVCRFGYFHRFYLKVEKTQTSQTNVV